MLSGTRDGIGFNAILCEDEVGGIGIVNPFDCAQGKLRGNEGSPC